MLAVCDKATLANAVFPVKGVQETGALLRLNFVEQDSEHPTVIEVVVVGPRVLEHLAQGALGKLSEPIRMTALVHALSLLSEEQCGKILADAAQKRAERNPS